MVVFICGSCNDSLKKSVVATHLARCKPASISCCDCSKEFSDDSYAKHNQCISEDAKYGPESQRSLQTKGKGAKKQEDWTNAIRETLKERNMSGRAEMVLNKLLEHANIPRIKNKFVNFLSNCSVKVAPEIIEEVWDICDAATKKMKTHAHQQTPDVKAKRVAQVTETPKDSKKKNKLKQSEGEEVESGETTLPESSEGPDQGESQVEGGDQTNGSSVITKQSKKKKKQSKESKEEGEEKENEKADEEMMVSNGEETSAEPNEVDNEVKNDEENSEPKSDDLKKKSKKKKKRNHSETEENQEKSSDSKEEDELNEGSNDNECDPKKKKMADEKEKETTTTSDTPMDQDADKMNGNANEEEPESQPINWFKQLKRQIKENETVGMKDFKKMIKKLKRSHNLTEDVSQITAKARVKLMKRHNYCVADGQIKYTHLF